MRFHETHHSVVHQGMSVPYKNINILLFLYGECGFAAPIIRNANDSVDIKLLFVIPFGIHRRKYNTAHTKKETPKRMDRFRVSFSLLRNR